MQILLDEPVTHSAATPWLMQAPALPAGTHLAYWDSDKASLLNNKGMEVYNHWGAVDENVQLPEHVISQFFTTRASYYDPTKVRGTAFRFLLLVQFRETIRLTCKQLLGFEVCPASALILHLR